MKASVRVSICGLKSKLPYINSFVENVKSEEKKYLVAFWFINTFFYFRFVLIYCMTSECIMLQVIIMTVSTHILIAFLTPRININRFTHILDCFHIFCTPCLEELLRNKSSLSCPLCRTVFAKQILPTLNCIHFRIFWN
jgi:hypothetical protein